MGTIENEETSSVHRFLINHFLSFSKYNPDTILRQHLCSPKMPNHCWYLENCMHFVFVFIVPKTFLPMFAVKWQTTVRYHWQLVPMRLVLWSKMGRGILYLAADIWYLISYILKWGGGSYILQLSGTWCPNAQMISNWFQSENFNSSYRLKTLGPLCLWQCL